MSKWRKLGLAAALTASLGMIGASVLTSAEDTTSAAEEFPVTEEGTAEDANDVIEKLGGVLPDDEVDTIQEVCSASMPAMVAITNTSVEEVRNYFRGDPFDFFFGYGGYDDYYGRGRNNSEPETRESVSSGSGIIIGLTDEDVLIATNEHVVSGADTLSVAFTDDTAASAEIVGTDATHDLAVIKTPVSELSKETLDAIAVIPFGSSSDLEVGESVVAIGNALGYGQSVSAGIVSALSRTISSYDYSTGRASSSDGMIQTDASINPGNSGGALLNLKGELIGINSAKYADTMVEGMGYAIPIDTAAPILLDLANGRSTETTSENNDDGSVRLDVTVATITEDDQASYLIPNGVYVIEVESGSPAEKAGVKKGDIITAIDDTVITTVEELKNALGGYAQGDSANLTVSRQGTGTFGDDGYETGTLTVVFGGGEIHMASAE